jgi:hypothetical protein
VSKEVRALIFRMAAENLTWGAPRIHGELLKLGFDLSERTVSRWVRRVPKNPDSAQRWLTFLRNHREAIAAMDFFTVPTLTFGVLYCFFIIGHDRRKILHFNVARNPNALWVVQQMREAWPYAPAHRLHCLRYASVRKLLGCKCSWCSVWSRAEAILSCTLMSVPAPRNIVEYECRKVCQPIFPIPARRAADLKWRRRMCC